MFRFIVTAVVTMTIAVLSTVLGLLPPDEEAHPPHVQLPDRGSTIAQAPGSSLEGLNPIGFVMTSMRVAAAEQRALAEQAAAEAAAAEIAVAEVPQPPAQAPSSVTADSSGWTEWDWQAECETGGDWSMQGSSYSGGLGFANSSWDAYGGQEFAPNAGMATREQQIIVAERIQDTPPVNGPGDACTGW